MSKSKASNAPTHSKHRPPLTHQEHEYDEEEEWMGGWRRQEARASTQSPTHPPTPVIMKQHPEPPPASNPTHPPTHPPHTAHRRHDEPVPPRAEACRAPRHGALW